MEPKEFSIEFPRGDTMPFLLSIKDEEGNVLIPSLGDEIYFTMKKNYSSRDVVLQKRFSSGDILIQDGELTFTLEHNDTADLKYGTYSYDIQLISGDFVRTLIIGEITLTNEATWKANE